MKYLIISITIILTSFTTNLDGGDPSVSAVCRIITENGEIHEGFLGLISGGLYGMRPNGFYFFSDDHYNWITLFDFELNSLKKMGNQSTELETLVLTRKKFII